MFYEGSSVVTLIDFPVGRSTVCSLKAILKRLIFMAFNLYICLSDCDRTTVQDCQRGTVRGCGGGEVQVLKGTVSRNGFGFL
jgi:hypothetical protein